MNRIRHPVVYTPGDRDWYDCAGRASGEGDLLGRLQELRRVFFAVPSKSLGATSLDLDTQATSTDFPELAENARLVHGGIVLMTLHVIRADMDISTREEARRGTDGAIVWAFETASRAAQLGASGGVIAVHAGIANGAPERTGEVYASIYEGLVELAQHAPVPLLVIHAGDEGYAADHPFRDPLTGRTIENLERLRTLTSPNIGWIEVDVDTTRERIFQFEVKMAPRSLRNP